MPARIRLVALDVDGTLLNSAGAVGPRVERSIRNAMAAGCQIVLATGRRLQSVTPIARQLGISNLILVDGAVIHDLDSESTLYEKTLTPALQRRAVDFLRAGDLPPILLESPVAGARIFAGPPELDNLETSGYLGRNASRGDAVVRVPTEHLVQLSRVVSVMGMGSLEQVERLAVQARDLTEFSTVFWNPWTPGYRTSVLALAPSDVSKGRALVWLANHLGIPPEQTMAIGDYDNDASMVEAAGLGVAMGNAVESVKAVARAVVADNDNDGVAEALEKWVLG